MRYRIRAADAKGRMQTRTLEASSAESAVHRLLDEGLHAVEVVEIPAAASGTAAGPASGAFRLSRRRLLEFLDAFSLLFSSGLSLSDALSSARSAFTKGPVRAVLDRLSGEVDAGRSFHDAVGALPEAFPPLVAGMVKLGERTGTLETVFQRLASHFERESKLREKTGSALMYPAFVLVVALAGLLLLAFVLMPRMTELFAGIGSEAMPTLPAMISGLRVAGFIVVALILAAVVGLPLVARSRKRGGRAAIVFDRAVLRLPLVGKMMERRELASFSFAMETLTSAGVPVEDALPDAGLVLRNAAFRAALASLRARVMKGEALSRAFASDDAKPFPERFAQWAGIGERSGKVDLIFGRLRRYYEGETERDAARISSLVEPVLIALVGIAIMLMVVFFVLPFLSIYGSLM